jgi:F-type H+-transporting ATPase subunit b
MELLRDPEFWVGIGTLIFIAIVIWKGVPGMVGTSLDARAGAIAKELDDARRLRAEAEALLAEYRAKRAAADQEASSIVAEAKVEAERFGAESRSAISAQIARRGKQAEEKIAQASGHSPGGLRGRRRWRDRSGGKTDHRKVR